MARWGGISSTDDQLLVGTGRRRARQKYMKKTNPSRYEAIKNRHRKVYGEHDTQMTFFDERKGCACGCGCLSLMVSIGMFLVTFVAVFGYKRRSAGDHQS